MQTCSRGLAFWLFVGKGDVNFHAQGFPPTVRAKSLTCRKHVARLSSLEPDVMRCAAQNNRPTDQKSTRELVGKKHRKRSAMRAQDLQRVVLGAPPAQF